MEDFNEYIRQQREAGTVESAGSFTLAIEKARDKLGSYSLAKPEDYILKIVQCAVAIPVQRLHVSFTWTTVLVYFETDQDDRTLSVDNLTNSLLNPLEEKNPARSYLAIALCAVAGQEPVELMWGDWDGDETSLILSLGHGRSELFRGVPFPRTEPLEPGRRLHLLYFKKRSTQKLSLSLTSADAEVLRTRCSLAPIPIEVDGQVLAPQLPVYVSRSDPVKQLTDLYFGALALKSSEQGSFYWRESRKAQVSQTFRSKLPPSFTPISSKLPPSFHFEKPEDWDEETETLTLGQIYGIPCYLYGPSQIHFLKDGVLMDPFMVHDAGGGAFALLNGDHLSTDLTGLQVIKDDTTEALVQETVESWKELVDNFIDGDPPIYRSTVVSSSDEAFWFVFGCCLIGPLAGILKPFLEYFIQSERKRAIAQKRYLRQLKTRRGYLAFFRKKD